MINSYLKRFWVSSLFSTNPMENMTTYSIKKYLPPSRSTEEDDQRRRAVFLWDPEIYRELFEIAYLAASEGYSLPNHPMFNNLEHYSYFKAWLSDNWKYLASYRKTGEVSGIVSKQTKTKGLQLNIQKNQTTLEEVITFLKANWDDESEYTTPDFNLSKDDRAIRQQISDEEIWFATKDQPIGFTTVQTHFSRFRVAYQAHKYIKSFVDDGTIHENLLWVYVANALGLFNASRSKKHLPHYSDSLEMMIWRHNKKSKNWEKDNFNGHPITKQWDGFIKEQKKKAQIWRRQCIEHFICLGKGVFPVTDECCSQLGFQASTKKTSVDDLNDFINQADRTYFSYSFDKKKQFASAFDSEKEEAERIASEIFLRTRITTESPFDSAHITNHIDYLKSVLTIKLSQNFCDTPLSSRIVWFNDFLLEIESCASEKYVSGLSDFVALLNKIKPYIENGNWCSDKGINAFTTEFEVHKRDGYLISHLFNSLNE